MLFRVGAGGCVLVIPSVCFFSVSLQPGLLSMSFGGGPLGRHSSPLLPGMFGVLCPAAEGESARVSRG